jgi:hypothetical protein
MTLGDDDRRGAKCEVLLDERGVGAGLGRAASAGVRSLVRNDTRAGRDDGNVEIALLDGATTRIATSGVWKNGFID